MLKTFQRSIYLTGRLLFPVLLTLSLVVLLALFTLRYWILPDIEKYHGDVVRIASQAIGLPVKVGKIEADLHWFSPHIVFTDIRLLDQAGNNVLELPRVENEVSWKTLLTGELRLRTLRIDRPDVLLRRDKQGVLHVAGQSISSQQSDGKLSDWLLHQSHIIVTDGRFTWQDDLNDKPPLLLDQMQLRLDNSADRHRFAVRLRPPAMVAAPFEARGDFSGNSFADLGKWHGELYAELDQADLDGWGVWLKLPEELSHGKGSLRTWLGIADGRLNRVTADMDLREVRGRLSASLPQLNLAGLHGRVSWHESENGFEVSSNKLALHMIDGFSLRPTDFYLRLAGSKDNPYATGEIQANSIELADLSMLADYIPLSQDIRQELAEFAPQGHIADLHAKWMGGGRFEVQAKLDKVFLNRVGEFPGIKGISGQINGNDNSGELSLNAPGLTVDAPQLLLEPVTFPSFQMHTSWQHKQDKWDVSLKNFSFANQDLSGSASGHYQTNGQGLGDINLNLNVSRASVKNFVKYLPRNLLGEETMSWLQTALQGGEMEDGHLRLHGPLKDFPFPGNKTGEFHVDARIKQGVVDYAKDWPPAENALLTLQINGQKLVLNASSATFAGAPVQQAEISIPDMLATAPVVQISGVTNAKTQQALDFIKHSPVRAMIAGFTDNTSATGNGRLDLKLEIPLSDKPVKLFSNYHFDGNDIKLDEYIPLAKKVTGDLTVTDALVQAKDIKAQIFGGPANISVQTEPGGAIKGSLHGKIDATAWHSMESSPWVQALDGSTDWNAELMVKGKQFDVKVASGLQGLSSRLPVPLAKDAATEFPLSFEFKSINASHDMMTLALGKLIDAEILRADNGHGQHYVKRGYVMIGQGVPVRNSDGIWVSGHLPLWSLEGWLDLLPANDGSSSLPPINNLDVTVQKAVGYSSVIHGLRIHARTHKNSLSAQLTAQELNGGLIWFPQGKGKLQLRLTNAVLGNAAPNRSKNKVPYAVLNGRVRMDKNISMPEIDAAVQHFTYNGKQLGQLQFHISQEKKDVMLDHLRLSNPDGVLSGGGSWQLDPSETRLKAQLQISNAGKLLNRLDYPNTLSAGSGTLDCDLSWAVPPDNLQLSKMDGQLEVDLKKGQFLKVDPGAGKLLSVLNLQSLPKHITLDFNDVFGQGFEFDRMNGAAQLNRGVLATDDFKIYGSAALVALAGKADLNKETQDLHVRVLPAIGNSVSLLAFAAGPAVGVGVFLANKLFRDPLDKLVSFEYNVTGSWADPTVEKINQVNSTPLNSTIFTQ